MDFPDFPTSPLAGPFSVGELARRVRGRVLGEETVWIKGVASPSAAKNGDLVFLAQPKYHKEILNTRASAALVTPQVAEELRAQGCSLILILCDNPLAAYAEVASCFYPVNVPAGSIHPSAVVAKTARIADDAVIGPLVCIGEEVEIGAGAFIGAGSVLGDRVTVGARTYLHARVVVYADCSVGVGVIIHSGAVIGADGFGLVEVARGEGPDKKMGWRKIPQIGRVIIGNEVEIGANTTIDRGALENTIIADGVKLDNQIQIGHNCYIGEHTAIAGCVGIAGSAKIGRHCKIGGAAMILGHLEIADRVTVSAGTLINKSILNPGVYTGSTPFTDYASWRKNAVHLRHLDRYVRRLNTLEQRHDKPENGQ